MVILFMEGLCNFYYGAIGLFEINQSRKLYFKVREGLTIGWPDVQKTTSTTVQTEDNPKDKTFLVGDISIPYEFIRKKNNKYIRIRICTDGMRVTAPTGISFSEVESLLGSKRNWIYKHYTQIQSINEEERDHTWEDGETVLYMGRDYNIRIFNCRGKKTSVGFNGKEFEVYVDSSISGAERDCSIKKAFKGWFIGRAREIIGNRLELFTEITGLKYNSFKIKEQKTRWGSCSGKGNLNFNWRIVMSPQWVVDYVVLHEICHLKYLNHSEKYWNMVSKYNPDYKKAKKWLKEHRLKL